MINNILVNILTNIKRMNLMKYMNLEYYKFLILSRIWLEKIEEYFKK